MNEYKAIKGCQKGNPNAQKFLFDKYSDGMLIICMRYVKQKEDAEEILLNGFYKFFTQIDIFHYAGDGSIGAWLKKIMINECLMFLRRRDVLRFSESIENVEISMDEEVISRLNANEIFRLIRDLPDGYRTVFNLYVIEGLGHKEIAFMLGISEGTSKSQLNKARSYLQKTMIRKGIYNEK